LYTAALRQAPRPSSAHLTGPRTGSQMPMDAKESQVGGEQILIPAWHRLPFQHCLPGSPVVWMRWRCRVRGRVGVTKAQRRAVRLSFGQQSRTLQAGIAQAQAHVFGPLSFTYSRKCFLHRHHRQCRRHRRRHRRRRCRRRRHLSRCCLRASVWSLGSTLT
jgi:hypothetical protein